ncbi:sulfotransferase 1 family member D1-like [Sycon ciliatum]|uniref:sulfotransferase 1 family member D1-like n=1 Tax=Sycon ciliatum TaxID=27933 RepID=UPI0020ADF82A|eukprot:scpid75379/ scgid35392/ Sulfotransferase 1C1; HAST-I; N-hydroxyarylamine sulfotransferase
MDAELQDKELAALEVFRERGKLFTTSAGLGAALNMKAKDSDIFVCTTAKAGTTWMQQICHQLRSGGDMDFEDISDVSPFLETAQDIGFDLDAGEQPCQPRVFNTHIWEPLVPKGGRYIVVVRHPYDVAVSFFKFMEGWFFEAGEISLDTFTNEEFLKQGRPDQERPTNCSAFHHMASWWPRHADPNVLWVFFEDMKEDLQAQVERVAAFMDITDPAVIAQAVHKSTFAFMKEHELQYSARRTKRLRNEAMGLKPEAGAGRGRVRVGGGEQHLLSHATKAAIDEKWRDICQPVLGAASYVEWRAAWKAEHAAK